MIRNQRTKFQALVQTHPLQELINTYKIKVDNYYDYELISHCLSYLVKKLELKFSVACNLNIFFLNEGEKHLNWCPLMSLIEWCKDTSRSLQGYKERGPWAISVPRKETPPPLACWMASPEGATPLKMTSFLWSQIAITCRRLTSNPSPVWKSHLWGSSKTPRLKMRRGKPTPPPAMLHVRSSTWKTGGSNLPPPHHIEDSSLWLPETGDGAWLSSPDGNARVTSQRVKSLVKTIASMPPGNDGWEKRLLEPALEGGDITPWPKNWNAAIARHLESLQSISSWQGEPIRAWSQPASGQTKPRVGSESRHRSTLSVLWLPAYNLNIEVPLSLYVCVYR